MRRAVFVGLAGSPGVGVGRLLQVNGAVGGPSAAMRSGRRDDPPSAAPKPADPSRERALLEAALVRAAEELEALARQTTDRAGAAVGAIFEAQALFARDPGIVDPAFALIAAGIAADEAISRVTEERADALAAVDDEYFRERAADVRDVGQRVVAILRGEPRPDLWHPDGRPAIIVAHDLDPSAVATLRRELVSGVALAGGAPTGHAAIVARALGIPLVLGLGTAIDGLEADVEGAVDGSAGRLILAPSAAEVDVLMKGLVATVDVEPGRLETHGITVSANVASALEAEAAVAAGADGIGLVRTELLFLGRHAPPSVAEQRATYARILAAMGERPVVFRTLDVGGDKPASWQHGPLESNPALGVRGIRLGLRRLALLDDQLEALLLAAGSGGRELHVMLPMVSTRDELDAARARLAAVRARLVESQAPVPDVRLGVMIEVPSAALTADSLAEAADFFSIGTNDLVQYTMAADRTNADLADLASALQPAVLRLIHGVALASRAAGRHVAVCGEAAADATVVPLLIGLGVEELSVAPASVSTVRALVAGLQPDACRSLADRALVAGTLAEVRAIVARRSPWRSASERPPAAP